MSPGRSPTSSLVHDLHAHEIELLLAVADFEEANERPMPRSELAAVAKLHPAEFARRLRYLAEVGLVRTGRERPLSEPGETVALTGVGTLCVIAERAAARALPTPGPRSRPSGLAAD